MSALTEFMHHMTIIFWMFYLAPSVIIAFFTYKLTGWFYKVTIIRLLIMLQKQTEKGTVGSQELKTILDARSYSEVKRHLKRHLKEQKAKAQ